MIKIVWDKQFETSYRHRVRLYPAMKNDFFASLDLFASDPFHPALRTHPLTGPLQGLWAFCCSPDLRVVFRFMKKNEALLVDIGSHEEVY